MTSTNALRTRMAHALPFYYGWVVAGNGVALSLSTRTVMAVATLSVFVVPMTQSMGWSVGMFSGAVSLGGLAAVFVSPIVGRWLDKYGAGVILGAGFVRHGGHRYWVGFRRASAGFLCPVRAGADDLLRAAGDGAAHGDQQLVHTAASGGAGSRSHRQGGRPWPWCRGR